MIDRIAAGVGKVRVEQGVPFRLVGVLVSNMKPDDSVVEAQVAQKAAEARTAAIKTLTDFLDQDPTGTRKMVYRMQVLQELTQTASANGHSTIFLTDLGGPSAGFSRCRAVVDADLGQPSRGAAARCRRSLIARPRPYSGIGITAIPVKEGWSRRRSIAKRLAAMAQN